MSVQHQQMGIEAYSSGGIDAVLKSPVARPVLSVKLRFHLFGRSNLSNARLLTCAVSSELFISSLEHSFIK